MIIDLSKEYTFEGKSYKSIDLDLDSLTGADLEAAEQAVVATSGAFATLIAETSKPFQIAVAARAAKLPVEFFRSLPANDCTKVTLAVSNFLLG